MTVLMKRIKKQWLRFEKFNVDLIDATASAQIKSYVFIGLLLLVCSIADYSVLYQSNQEIIIGFKIKVATVCYYLLAPLLMLFIHRYNRRWVIKYAYFNIMFGLLVVLFGPLYPSFSLNLSELFALILVPSMTVYGPGIIYQIIVFIIISIDVLLELYYFKGDNVLLYMMYYTFDSFCLYGMVSFVNSVIVANKIKELKIRYKLKKVSETDALTGLLNRSAIISAINQHQSVAGNYGLIVIDLDSFKYINDTYGHLTGDEVLKYMGQVLKMTFQDIGLIGRFGGDEFIIFFENIEEELLKERLKQLKLNFKNSNPEFSTYSFSFGYSIVENQAELELFKDLFHRADLNMYKQKASKKS